MKKLAFALCVVILPFGSTALYAQNGRDVHSAAKEKTRIVRTWLSYFQSVRSLDFSYKTTFQRSTFAPMNGKQYKYKVVVDGNKFRMDASYPNGGDVLSDTVAYDGKTYQSLTVNSQGSSVLTHRSTPKSSVLLYGNSLPLLNVFEFARGRDDKIGISTFQNPKTWQQVVRRIEKIEPGIWQGIRGKFLTLKGKSKYSTTSLFVEGATLFPIYSKTIDNTNRDRSTQNVTEMKVLGHKRLRVGNRNFVFPTKCEYTDSNGASVTLDEVIGNVKINQAVKNKKIFLIPRSQATTVIDFDRQRQELTQGKR